MTMVVNNSQVKNAQDNAHKEPPILGLVAGEGKLPAILARSAKDRGYKVVALALSEDAVARVKPHADAVHLIAPGQLSRNVNLALKDGVKEVVFIGKVPKINLLRNIHKLDWTAVKELSKMPNFNDDTIQRGVGNYMESMGIRVLRQTDFLKHLFPDYGVMTKKQPSAAEYADVEFGYKLAKEIARLDIGQTIIVKDQMVLAIEALEGTDEAIKRGVSLARGPVVVVKVARNNHDPRFDVPTVGMTTLEAIAASKQGGILAVEAHQTLLVEKEEMIQYAEEHGISILAV